jgi:hypothetical protein
MDRYNEILNVPVSRLLNQGLAHAAFGKPEDVVSWFGAVQAQDYLGSLWGIGQRARGATEASVEAAESRRAIVRTWPMRGTLHFVAAADARWITQLLAPRIIARNTGRWERDFGVTTRLLGRADEVVSRALEGGRRLARDQLYAALEARRIRTGGSRGLHLLLILAMRGRLCLAGRLGKQHSFALLDEWIPSSRSFDREAALAELARRYFTSHGPATLKDFCWWAGLTVKDAQAALESVKAELTSRDLGGSRFWWREDGRSAGRVKYPHVRLLPAYDEFTVAYQDRSLLVGRRAPASKMSLLSPAVLVNGRVVGTWSRSLGKDVVSIHSKLHARLSRDESAALNRAAASYGEFLTLDAQLAL